MTDNYWDKHMGTDSGAATYMHQYGEGAGSETRRILGGFINDGESVLDEGCGPGWNYDHFQKYGPKISEYKGRDYSERFIRVANRRTLARYGESPFELGDCRNITEPDGSWDVVLLQDVLEHTSGYEQTMAEALRVAKKRIIVTFWRGQMLDGYANDSGTSHVRDDGDDGWCGEYSRIEWEKYLDTLGYHWLETQSPPGSNRWHIFYIIDKQVQHG